MPRVYAFWLTLPTYHDGMEVKCPTKNMDGTPAKDVCGCGSTNVGWDGEVYDCYECGIWFSDYAADPPHRRLDGDEVEEVSLT